VYFYGVKEKLIEKVDLENIGMPEFTALMKKHNFEMILTSSTFKIPGNIVSSVTLGENHYEFYGKMEKLKFWDANFFAKKRIHEGKTGRLLSLWCLEQETELLKWMKKALPDTKEMPVWLDASDQELETSWRWLHTKRLFWHFDHNAPVPGEPNAYSNWRKYDEPNNDKKSEHCATFQFGGWNDVECDAAKSIIVEFGPNYPSICNVSFNANPADVKQDL